MSQKNIRVRFAPSPTGPLHIGGVRTALYNYLFAKKHNGSLVLRIEDTDRSRFVPGAEEYIINSLTWCGITFDEGGMTTGGQYGPYKQSDRKSLYKNYADQLIDSGNAYYAFDTPEELKQMRRQFESEKKTFTYDAAHRDRLKNSLTLSKEKVRKLLADNVPHVIRFKIPEDETIVMDDLIRGKVEVNTDVLDDKILFKSDGMPTYHLANVVDDHLMLISHVIRGEEWLPSLPLHILLYRAFGWEAPRFAHLPLLLKPEGHGKLSKRDGDRLGFPVFPLQWKDPKTGEISKGYKEEGYFPEAVVNMLALLGWNPGNEQELFTISELINAFSLEKVGKSGSKFDPDKAQWFNHQYLVKKPNEELKALFVPFLEQHGVDPEKFPVSYIISLVKERVNFVHEMWDQTHFFFIAPTEFEPKAVKKRWKTESYTQIKMLIPVLRSIDEFTSENLEAIVKHWIEKEGFGIGMVLNAFRLLVVGALKGPHLFDIVSVLGKEETISRLEFGLNTLGKKI